MNQSKTARAASLSLTDNMLDAAYTALRRNALVSAVWCDGYIDGAAVEWPMWLDVLEASFILYMGVAWNQLSRITQRARRA